MTEFSGALHEQREHGSNLQETVNDYRKWRLDQEICLEDMEEKVHYCLLIL